MNYTKIIKADLGSPQQDIFNGGLGIVLALLVFPAIDFSCASTWGSIQL